MHRPAKVPLLPPHTNTPTPLTNALPGTRNRKRNQRRSDPNLKSREGARRQTRPVLEGEEEDHKDDDEYEQLPDPRGGVLTAEVKSWIKGVQSVAQQLISQLMQQLVSQLK